VAVRMGKGKGPIKEWIAPLRAGKCLFEITGSSAVKDELALRKARRVLPVKTHVIRVKY
jgi:large subunit ribosomal protein L16